MLNLLFNGMFIKVKYGVIKQHAFINKLLGLRRFVSFRSCKTFLFNIF